MKPFMTAMGLLLCCTWLHNGWAQTETAPTPPKSWVIELELTPGLSSAIDMKTGENWDGWFGFGSGLNCCYSPSPRVWLRTGLSQHLVYTHRKVVHPYPYVMNMDLIMTAHSTRLMAGCDYAWHEYDEGRAFLYVGGGLYADVIHSANVEKKLNYVSGTEYDRVDMKHAFPTPVPGFLINLGVQGSTGRLELRHWEDIRTFDVPSVPIGGQRRVFWGVNAALFLKRPAGN